MSETSRDALPSHTLAYLRQIDRRVQQLADLVIRQQDLIGRLDRDMREGFSVVQRDIGEMKGDLVLMENRIVSAVAADYATGSRLDDAEERLAALEAARTDL